MPIDERWDALDSEQWSSFVDAWLNEVDNECDIENSPYASRVAWLMFTARPEQLWKFILLSIERATTDVQLGYVAAGPVERLLGQNGSEYIALVEAQAQADLKFARMLAGVWRYEMTDDTWNRVESLQVRYPYHLSTVDCHDHFIKIEENHRDRLKKALRQRRESNGGGSA